MPIGKKYDHMRRCAALVLIFSLLVQIFGCAREAGGEKKLRDIEYEVVAAQDIPQSAAEIIEEKKETGFHFTYSEKGGFLYCCRIWAERYRRIQYQCGRSV